MKVKYSFLIFFFHLHVCVMNICMCRGTRAYSCMRRLELSTICLLSGLRETQDKWLTVVSVSIKACASPQALSANTCSRHRGSSSSSCHTSYPKLLYAGSPHPPASRSHITVSFWPSASLARSPVGSLALPPWFSTLVPPSLLWTSSWSYLV